MSIEVKGLTKNYGEQKAVNDVSFAIGRGEIVGFLGPNGAGKSTTMKIITGYLAADAGQAVVCGIDVKERPLEAKAKIGYLPEANPLYFDMYVREYLDFVADVHHVQYKKQTIEKVIETVGLTPESKKKIGQLSKGYKQRVGLAAALIHDPEVLVLDEPTTGLDPNQILEIRELIRTLGVNKTVIFSSHILQEVEAICDRVVIINKGQLVADDSLTALRSRSNHTATLKVIFKEPLEAAWMERLSAVDKVNRITPNEWELVCKDVQEANKQLMELALQHNLNIVSLQSGEQSLEEVFRSLTSSSTKQ
ncbi:gliding motility-associated ABC transporter ATP-binding subunit GldA [Pseudobacter ginsenosidimutans]|uniref:Protein involved in gliding motility GldA n=1 Tax=Pseudobacter ginsenosidimutans TaxID=661488 RepID=A0A4Q7MTG1_9BACT|nr:gliding motility-associated ABC transporter ATP-binding subunit GldA [Pseudobacter ginsenosidimutans]QEC41099.1 gliding motility-associated ABC transporter ATP-binding subunit GldA [Pseudobacter ginsenosidimutans]RZS72142.1 protein involved in gliding motility GldA [Pseudobacter ginsenosidimutans]